MTAGLSRPSTDMTSPGDGRGVIRVLWLAKGLGRGGAEQLLVEMAGCVDHTRYRVDVAYTMPIKDALVAQLRAEGIEVLCLGRPDERSPMWMLRLRSLVARRDYDIVHSHMPVPAVGARLALLGTRRRLVHTEHNVWRRYRRMTYWANALTYRRNDRVIAVSQAVADSIGRRWLGKRPERAPLVIRHGVRLRPVTDGDARASARDTLNVPEDCFVIGAVGNLTAKKAHRDLIEAFALFREQIAIPSRLIIIGTGPLLDSLRNDVWARRLEREIILLGSRADVPQLLPAFDVFASSSLYEGFPIAILEAMGAGLPVIATDVGGTAELVRDGIDGLLVAPGDCAALAAGLRTLAEDGPGRREFGRAARLRSSDFDIGTAVLRTEGLYDELVATR